MSFFTIFKHLLPRAKAFSITINKQLRQYIDGLAVEPQNSLDYMDEVFLDIFPDMTRELDAWEKQFGLPVAPSTWTTQDRRDRLTRAWKKSPGQSPRRIQDALQAEGFDVYVYDWWYFDNAITDGDMEAATTAAWVAGASATLTKDTTDPHSGIRCLRVAYNGVTNPNAQQQFIMTPGQMYHITGWGRSDGTCIPRVWDGGGFIWTGTSSVSWQSLDLNFIASGQNIVLFSFGSSGYCEFDDFIIESLSDPQTHDPNDIIGQAVQLNPLVNKILRVEKNYLVEAGDDGVVVGTNQECGEPHMECGNYDGFQNLYKIYPIPTDTDRWKQFLYIGGSTIDTPLSIDENRRSEFEDLCLKLCPLEKWIGFIAEPVLIYFASDWNGDGGDEAAAISGLVSWANTFHTKGVDVDWSDFYTQGNILFPGDFVNNSSAWGFSTTAIPTDPVSSSGDPSSITITVNQTAVFAIARADLYTGA